MRTPPPTGPTDTGAATPGMRRLAINTGGGDAPGAAPRTADHLDWEIYERDSGAQRTRAHELRGCEEIPSRRRA